MTSQPTTTPRSGCPELERLAALAEGRLKGTERTALLEHLADCDDCRELVAETIALAGEIAGERRGGSGAVVPFPRPESGRRRRWLVAAAGLAVIASAIYFARQARPGVDATLAALASEPDVARGLGDGWSEPRWSVTRGEGPAVSARARAFRLGVRSADLELALGSADRTAARRLAAESALLLGDVPLAAPVASVYRELAQKLSSADASTGAFALAVGTGRALAREAVDPAYYDLGRWAEASRLLVLAGARLPTPYPPSLPVGAEELAPPFDQALAQTRKGAPPAAALLPVLERLVAAGGDLR